MNPDTAERTATNAACAPEVCPESTERATPIVPAIPRSPHRWLTLAELRAGAVPVPDRDHVEQRDGTWVFWTAEAERVYQASLQAPARPPATLDPERAAMLASWTPALHLAEPSTPGEGAWLALGVDAAVSALGDTPDAAVTEATRWTRATLADPDGAAECWGDELPASVVEAVGPLHLLEVRGSAEALRALRGILRAASGLREGA